MEAGALRHRVTLLQPALTVNSTGETTIAFTSFREVWADVQPLRGWEVERARQVQTNTTHRVRIRYLPEVRGSWAVQWGSQTLYIRGIVNPDGRNIELELSCEQEGVIA